MSKKSDLEATISLHKFKEINRTIVSVVTSIIKYGVLFYIAKEGFACLSAMAGLETKADIAFKLVTDLKADRVFGLLFGFGGIAYGKSQNSLKKKSVKRLQKRNQELEKIIDPKRKSSGLPSNGDTSPEDLP